MKAHITNNKQDKLLEETVKKALAKARNDGLAIGAKAVSKVILDKLENVTAETAMVVIDDIIKFCKTGLGENKPNE